MNIKAPKFTVLWLTSDLVSLTGASSNSPSLADHQNCTYSSIKTLMIIQAWVCGKKKILSYKQCAQTQLHDAAKMVADDYQNPTLVSSSDEGGNNTSGFPFQLFLHSATIMATTISTDHFLNPGWRLQMSHSPVSSGRRRLKDLSTILIQQIDLYLAWIIRINRS